MKALLKLIGIAAGSSIGWWIGEQVGLMTAVILSSVGAALGLYIIIIVDKKYLT